MPYIFVHGLGQNSDSWKDLVNDLKLDEKVFIPDLVKLIDKQDVSYKNLYNSFSVICNDNKEKLNLCGLSLGAILCLNYAIDNPNKVDSLVLIAPQFKIPRFLFKLQNTIFKIMPKSMFDNMGFSKHETVTLTKSMTNIDFTNDLNSVTCPTLILCGDKDSANLKSAMQLNNLLSNSQFKSIPNAKHEVNVDNPDDLAALLKIFYKGLGIH